MDRKRFSKVWERVFFYTPDDSIHDKLDQGYGSEDRHYHNWDHIHSMLAGLDEYVQQGTYCTRPEIDRIEIAIWFHDVVYDATRTDNEWKSAELLGDSAGWKNTHTLDPIMTMIMDTRHRAPPRTIAGRILCDLDLVGLGSPWEVYADNGARIRREFSHLHDIEWVTGRTAFCKNMLDRDFIYYSERYADLEKQARDNLQRELDSLNIS